MLLRKLRLRPLSSAATTLRMLRHGLSDKFSNFARGFTARRCPQWCTVPQQNAPQINPIEKVLQVMNDMEVEDDKERKAEEVSITTFASW